MESKENFEWRNQNNGTNGIVEIDVANTTDGGIVIHGADLYDEIDGTYEKNGHYTAHRAVVRSVSSY